VVDSLSCTILDSATKRLKESDLVVTQPSKQLRWIIKFENPNTTVWKSKNNLNSFARKLDGDMKPEDMNMDDKFGITLQKAQPLRIVPLKLSN